MFSVRCGTDWRWVAVGVLGLSAVGLADGGLFVVTGSAADLAQIRQEAVMALEDDAVVYVLRSLYEGTANELAWVMPLPETPTDIVALADSRLFEALDYETRPRFSVGSFRPSGCGCAAAGGGGGGALTQVEASGQAGPYDWAALTSSGADSLLTWLNDHGYDVPASAEDILDGYIDAGMHFLAVQVREEAGLSTEDVREIPPLQFRVATTRRFYPMAISAVSAAADTEVILYVLGEHRAQGANIPTGEIDEASLVADPTSPSMTNYEQLFMARIAELGGLALITESAGYPILTPEDWPEGTFLENSASWFVTRLRTVVPRELMTLDFELEDAATDDYVSNYFYLEDQDQTLTSMALGPVGVLCVCGAWKTYRRRRRRSPTGVGRSGDE
ncbi:MAG: DUF2330 domain-containing protein [Planctomycetota bacterium]